MEILKKKYLSLTSLLTSLSNSVLINNQNIVAIFLLGLCLIGFGVLSYKTGLFTSNDKIEVINSPTETQNTNSLIVVEIGGSIERAGVYKMPPDSRIEDLLIVSGGLSADADREWVNKNVNRASKLQDGQKVYIYSQSEVSSAKEDSGIKLDQPVLGVSSTGLVNINTASLSELDKLPGIGQVYGQSIIEHRPYSDVQELVSKGAISQKVLEKIKNEISL